LPSLSVPSLDSIQPVAQLPLRPVAPFISASLASDTTLKTEPTLHIRSNRQDEHYP
jgi:hypothetical protein